MFSVELIAFAHNFKFKAFIDIEDISNSKILDHNQLFKIQRVVILHIRKCF